jgi:uncharacterized protein YfaS (alpha-2-macroglobulin family)
MTFRQLGLILVCAALLVATGCGLRKGYRKVRMPSFSAAELKAAPELTVVSAIPKGEIEAAGEAEEILVSFSDAMVTLGEDSARPDFPLLLKPDVPGRVTWLGTKTLSFHPDTTLPVATEFVATIPTGAKSLAGAMLRQDYTFKFQTQRPKLLRSAPRDGEQWVGRNEPVYLGFNLPMDPRRAQRFVHLTSGRGNAGFRLRQMTEADQQKLATQPDRRWYAEDFAPERTLVLEPTGKYGTESKYTITLAEGLKAREGNLGLDEQVSVKFETEHVFAFLNLPEAENHAPEEALAFSFSNPVSTGELAKNISFLPALEIPEYYTSGEYSNDVVRLSLDLKADTDYTVRISGKLKDRFGNRLGKDIVKKLHTIDYATRVSMPDGHSITESYGSRNYPVTFLNPDSVQLTIAKLSPEEWIRLWQESDQSGMDSAFDRLAGVNRIWKPGTKRNQRQVLGIGLDEVLNRNENGCVALRVTRFVPNPAKSVRARGQKPVPAGLAYRKQSFHAFTQVTGIGITGKFGPEGELLFVTDLKTAQPLAGAQVELKNPNLGTVWTGRTDRNGMAEAPGWLELGFGGQGAGGGDGEGESYYDAPQLWAFARTEGQTANSDLAFIASSWGTGVAPYELGLNYDWSAQARSAQGFLFSEKGLYHSGDTVHLKGIVRDRRKGQWVLPETRSCSLVITDARDENVVRTEINLSRFGSLDYTFRLKPDAPSGSYSAVMKYGRLEFPARLEVAAYRPAEFEVKVTSPEEQYVAGDKFTATVLGKYLFGAMMSGEKASWTLTLQPYYFSATGFEDFDFTSEPEYGRVESEGGDVLARGLGKLDKDGKLELSANLDLKTAKSSMVLMAEATVTGPNQRDISGGNSFVVHRGEFYVGTRAKERFLHVKDTLRLEVVTVDHDAKVAPGQNVTIEFFRRNWQSVRKAGFGGRYNWVSKPEDKLVARRGVRTGKEPVVEKFSPTEPGSYVVKCSARDRKGNLIANSLNLYVTGSGKAGWEMRDDDVVELVRDRPGYQPGDKAEILIKSPYEQCRALVTVEREYVLDKFTVELQGNAPTVTIPIKPDYLPNVFVSVVLLKGRTGDSARTDRNEDLAKPGFKIGYVELPVKPDEKRLRVTVSPDRSEYRPGDEVVLDVEVKGSGAGSQGTGDRGQGSGVEAEVTLAVVDLGVLKLIGYDTPDPFSVFHASRPLSVVTAESRLHVIGQRSYGEKGENRGGGGAEAGRAYRQKFLETALWLPAVQTDADGHARARFKLPDNLSTFKIMAVAHSADRFGSGDSSFRVNQPLLLQAALPMFLRDGDEFEAGAVVFNNTSVKGEAVLLAGAQGAELVGDSVQKVTLQAHSSKEIRFLYRVSPPGDGSQGSGNGGQGEREAEFRFHCRMGSETDGLKLKLPIRNPVITEAYALYEQTPDSARQPLSLPAGARPGFGAVQLTLASSGLVGLEPGLRWLQEYPYECLEQKISRALPFVVGAELVNTFKLSDLTGDALRRLVQQTINQVWTFQDARGGFHFWRSDDYYEPASPWLSAYCLYFLARAQEQGYELDAARVNDAKKFMLDLLANPGQDGWHGYNHDCRAATRAYIAYALALWNEDMRGYLPELYASRDSLSLTGQACLLKTLARQGTLAGRDEMMAEIARRFRNMAKYAPATAHFEEEDAERYSWIWSSNARTTAVVLQALLEALGTTEDAEKIVQWLLLERRNGRWRTTQENAWVFDALTTYYRRYEPDAPDFSASVNLEVKGALKEIMRASFKGRSLATQQRNVPLDSMKALVGDTLTELRFEKQGPGRLYYGVRLTIAPDNLKPRVEGLLVRKSITGLDGKPVKEFSRGEFYKITLKVYTPQERLFVALDDPLPAGFEVVNTDFATTSQRLRDRLSRLQREAGERWWGSFDHQEIYSDKYRLFATSLLEGAHTYVYIVKALTSGRFSLPGTKVEEMYTPEVFGLTGQQEIRVRN